MRENVASGFLVAQVNSTFGGKMKREDEILNVKVEMRLVLIK